jgi:Ca2+-binding EF-hand superfamily protein
MFPFSRDFSATEMNLLVERYTTDAGDVNYQALSDDISDMKTTMEPPPFPQSPGRVRPDMAEWDHASVLAVERLRAVVVERRLRLREQFQDWDPLRKGVCTVSNVISVFTVLQLNPSTEDMNQIIEMYTVSEGKFAYEAFCEQIDSAFTQTGLEMNPRSRIDMPNASTTLIARRDRMRLTADEEEQVGKLEDKIRSRIRKQRILLKPGFQDFDKVRRGIVTRDQFSRIMGMAGFELTESQVSLLCKVYCDRGNHNEFNYIDFCESCDKKSESDITAMGQYQAPYQPHQSSKYFDASGRVLSMSGEIRGLRGLEV